MKFRKLLLSIFSIITALMLSACASSSVDKNVHARTNVLGIYESQEEAYTATTPATVHITSDELWGMDLPSGKKKSYLWGFITFTDY